MIYVHFFPDAFVSINRTDLSSVDCNLIQKQIVHQAPDQPLLFLYFPDCRVTLGLLVPRVPTDPQGEQGTPASKDQRVTKVTLVVVAS